MQLVKLNKRPLCSGRKFTYILRYTENGKRKWETLGHTDRRKAERQRTQKEKELRMGYIEPSSMRLRDFMEDSLARTGDQIRESTRIDYQGAMEDFITTIGNIDYKRVQQTHGELFRQACLDRGDSPATVAKKLRGLKRFFGLAVERKQLDENPLQYVRQPKVPKQRIKIYTAEEINRILRVASQFQNTSVLEWDLLITLAITTGMRKSEMLNLVWSDINFSEMTIEVTPKENTEETWEWKIKDTDRRCLPLKEDVSRLLVNLQNRRPEGYPYVLVPPGRYDHIQQELRPEGKWTLSSARNSVINNFTKQFNQILAMAHVEKRTFHDIRKTAITNWFRQGLTEYDVMTLAGHANFATTHKFYLAVADDLVARARNATTHQVSQELLQKCCQNSLRGAK
ncbi:MAG: tyrosine-type recombinase/integrase [Planctomycetota bacterium]|jgi:integrase